jgi:O-antigen/teichoic acid export membrane protein
MPDSRAPDEVEGEAIAAEDGPPDQLTVEEVKSRAVHGTATLGTRSVLTFGLGVVSNLVLARLLVPRDFGLVALGTTIIAIASFLSESGIGAALIGRREPPERDELQAVLGLQLAVTIVLLVCFTAAAWPFGRAGMVPALMLTSLPLASLRLPNVLVLERQVSYRAIARADVLEAASGSVWAIATVAAGLGVWGLASAAPVRVLVGTLVLIRLGPLGFVRPIWAWRLVRPILRFGVRFQAANAVGAIRDQGLNTGIAVVAGFSALGLWSLAYRIMSVPVLLYVSLWRVGYPAMSRLLDAGENPRPVIERAIGVVAVAMSPLLVGIAVSAPALLPALVGDRWSGTADIVVWGCAATMVNAPISVPCEGYLLAAGHVSKVLLAAVVGAVIWLGFALSLLVPLGPGAIGLGWFAMAFVEAVMFGWWVGRGIGVQVITSVVRPLTVAVAAGSAGVAVASLGDGGLLIGIGGLVAAELVLLAGLYAVAGDSLRATLRLGGRAVATARAA